MNDYRKNYAIIFTNLISIILLACCFNLINKVDKLNEKIDKLIQYQQEHQVPDNYTITFDGEISITNLDEIIVTETEEVAIKNDDPTLAKSRYAEIIDGLTEYEKDLICRIAFREAGNQCEEGQRAVMEVILNRVESDVWPDTVEEVLSQPHQFSTWNGRNRVSEEHIEDMEEILDKVYTEEPVLSDNYVYFNSLSNPQMNNRIKIQDHWFGTGNS